MKMNCFLDEIFPLFERVQKEEIFPDQKQMADAIPKKSAKEIMANYFAEEKDPNFDLKRFIEEHFVFAKEKNTNIQDQLPIEEHIEQLWNKLKRSSPNNVGTQMHLPYPYIVPGGRFSEFFYWDSYFVLLGLQVNNQHQLIRNIIDNCVYLIQELGYVPNGNRTYFLGRSQPPYFSLMVELLAEIDGDEVFEKYLEPLQKEYDFWMKGHNVLTKDHPVEARVVLMEGGEILNRYFDEINLPRPESFLIDLKDNERSNRSDFYSNIRSACESGWDFSSRWFQDQQNITTIEINDLVPVELNALLGNLEKVLAKAYSLTGNVQQAELFRAKEIARKSALKKYFWDPEEQFFFDYHHKKQERKITFHIAAVYPLFLNQTEENIAIAVAEKIKKDFVQNGGVLTTLQQSGQQWDAPNGWAPFQWISFVAMQNYGQTDVAKSIRDNWCTNVERVYQNTGKLMEKYNVEDIALAAGGGEYPNQDGFGWTNGVYIKLKKEKHNF